MNVKLTLAIVSIKSFAKEIRKILIDKITQTQRKLLVSVYITHETNFQILLNVTWRRFKCSHRNCNGLKMKFSMH